MYNLVLLAHSWLRWVSFITGVLAVNALRGDDHSPAREAAGTRWSLAFMMTLDIQMLLGLSLYFTLSPAMKAIFENFGGAMKDPVARFWAVEHVTTMLFAVVIVHVGRVLSRKGATPAIRRGRLVLCLIAALVAMLAATPWPGLAAGRPFFRFS